MTPKKEALAMLYALHKFHHYLLGNKLIFYVDHMALLYLAQVSRRLARWLLLFLEYDFSVICKPRRSHFVVDALFQMLDLIEESGVLD